MNSLLPSVATSASDYAHGAPSFPFRSSHLAAIDWGGMSQVIVVSAFAGILTTTIFSAVILATSHSNEARRHGRQKAAVLYATAALIAFAAFAGLVVFGLEIMLRKV